MSAPRPPSFLPFSATFLGATPTQLSELSETDALTRLLNARGFAARLQAETRRSKRYREPLSLLFLDLDGLKEINDRYGHRAGSETLRHVGRLIRAELRETDTGARWGGDEFTIIAPNTDKAEAVTFAERIRSRIASHSAGWPMTASIGIATLDGENAGMPVRCAHAAARRGCGDVRSETARKEYGCCETRSAGRSERSGAGRPPAPDRSVC